LTSSSGHVGQQQVLFCVSLLGPQAVWGHHTMMLVTCSKVMKLSVSSASRNKITKETC